MKVLLLLAGRSRRFWPLAEKSLFPVAGKALLEHQIERLREGGLEEIILVGGKHNLESAHALFPGFPIIEQENLDLGMQGALLSALPACGDEPVMIVSSNDVVESGAYAGLMKDSRKSGVDGVILGKRATQYFPGGYLTVDGRRAKAIVEKPGRGNEPSDLVNIVAHVHNDAAMLLRALKGVSSDRDDAYEVALHQLMQQHVYMVSLYEGFWQPVKYPWHLLELLPMFLPANGKPMIPKSCVVHKSAVIEGPVALGERVKVLPHATIVGPAFIGEDSIIGTNVLVRGSSIGRRCVIGYNSEVKASVLHSDIWTHSTYIGDSIIGSNVGFGGGTTIGNFRLDEGEVRSGDLPTGRVKLGAVIGSDIRIGIHVGMNPGVKIGSGTFIGGGAYLTEDIPEKSFVSMKDGILTVRENRSETPRSELREKFRK